jgi:tetratricopeptide (TPR) repeat protein
LAVVHDGCDSIFAHLLIRFIASCQMSRSSTVLLLTYYSRDMKLAGYLLTFVLGIFVGVLYSPTGEKIISISKESVFKPGQNQETHDSREPSNEIASVNEPASGGVSSNSQLETKPVSKKELIAFKEDFERFFHSDQYEKALAVLDELEKVARHSKEFLESKTRYLVRTREWENAKELLKECLDLFPNSKTCLDDMSSTEFETGSKEDQFRALTNCLQHYPNYPNCLNSMAVWYMHNGNPQEAIKIYQRLITHNGGYGFTFDEGFLFGQMSWALERAGKIREAAEYAEKACRLNEQAHCRRREDLRSRS